MTQMKSLFKDLISLNFTTINKIRTLFLKSLLCLSNMMKLSFGNLLNICMKYWQVKDQFEMNNPP